MSFIWFSIGVIAGIIVAAIYVAWKRLNDWDENWVEEDLQP